MKNKNFKDTVERLMQKYYKNVKKSEMSSESFKDSVKRVLRELSEKTGREIEILEGDDIVHVFYGLKLLRYSTKSQIYIEAPHPMLLTEYRNFAKKNKLELTKDGWELYAGDVDFVKVPVLLELGWFKKEDLDKELRDLE
jgi:hypothetical protein